jgi:hypothetical protein
MTRTIFIAAGLALAAALPAPAAQAQASRTFVSAAGSDSNNCITVTAPCRHFKAAYALTLANGEIYVLDPANYGSLTITGPVSIEGHGWASSSALSGGSAAITINANTGDKINIIGVVLDGTAIASSIGIQFNSGGTLTVRDSVIRNFTDDGIQFSPDASTQLFVSNTLVSDNGTNGIQILANGSGTTTGVLDHVTMENNHSHGLFVLTAAQTVNVTVSDSVSANNTSNGIYAESTGAGPASVMVWNSTIANNGNDGLLASGAAVIRVTRSTITGNTTGWAIATTGTPISTGIVWSYADNNIDGNGSNNSTPGTAIPYH